MKPWFFVGAAGYSPRFYWERLTAFSAQGSPNKPEPPRIESTEAGYRGGLVTPPLSKTEVYADRYVQVHRLTCRRRPKDM